MIGRLGKMTRKGTLWDNTLEHIEGFMDDGDMFLIVGLPDVYRPYIPVITRGKMGWVLDSGWRYVC